MFQGLILYKFEIVIPAIVAILVGITFFKNSKSLRVGTVILIALGLLYREFYISVHRRVVMADCNLRGDALNHFVDGMNAVKDYYIHTALYVIVIIVLLLVLCIRGFNNQDRSRAHPHAQ